MKHRLSLAHPDANERQQPLLGLVAIVLVQLVPLVIRLLDELVDATLEVLGNGSLTLEIDVLIVGLNLRKGKLLEDERANRAKADRFELELLALHFHERDVSAGDGENQLRDDTRENEGKRKPHLGMASPLAKLVAMLLPGWTM